MNGNRFLVLDGWRGISILMVLAAHLLPLGPQSWQLNATAGPLGMALFFTLSGFLITHSLYGNPSVKIFIIRRVFRIVPLAWLYFAISFLFIPTNTESMKALLFFYANWPPMDFTLITTHIWSLCVEMQFYLGIAVIVLLIGKKGLGLIPVLCLCITLNRIHADVTIAVNTYYRVDEILIGGVLALFYNSPKTYIVHVLERLNPLYILLLLVISCHPESGFLGYLRPYFAALLVAVTLYNSQSNLTKVLLIKPLSYLAVISYALYVIHPILNHGWLGEGDSIEKYLKRPFLFIILFLLAHMSTFYYEKHWITWAKRITTKT